MTSKVKSSLVQFNLPPTETHSISAGRPMSLAMGVRAMHAQTLDGMMGWPLHLHSRY